MQLGDARLPERFWSKIRVAPNGCWLWTACIQNRGYGVYSIRHIKYLAHRVAYQTLVGDVPQGLQLDHVCRSRSCCNPAHLEPVTNRENTMRGEKPGMLTGPALANKLKTRCKIGHPFSRENTLIVGHSRHCRICRLERLRNWRKRRDTDPVRRAEYLADRRRAKALKRHEHIPESETHFIKPETA